MANLVDAFKELEVNGEVINGIKESVLKDNYGKFTVSPLEKGFGLTIGNALRRVLLSALPGASVFAIKIEGVAHEFSALEGVEEDVTALILNLKGLVMKIGDPATTDGRYTLRLNVTGPKVVTAADLECPSEVEIVNKDLVLANVAEGGKLDMQIFVRNGRGFLTSESNKEQQYYKEHYANVMGIIATDSNYSPILRANYRVEPARVQHDSNYDKLILEVETNGSITPQEAIALSSQMLINYFSSYAALVSNYKEIDMVQEAKQEQKDEPQVNSPIEDFDFSPRSYNCLKRADISTIKQLLEKSESDLTKIRNLGRKSIKEIKDKLRSKGLSLKEEENIDADSDILVDEEE